MSTWILIEEIEQLFLEKWSDWKSSFSKTNGNFSASPVYQGADKREKCKDFSMEYPFAKKRISIQSWMKKRKRVFSEKKELQPRWISILFARFLNVRIPKCSVAADIISNKFFFYKISSTENKNNRWRILCQRQKCTQKMKTLSTRTYLKYPRR